MKQELISALRTTIGIADELKRLCIESLPPSGSVASVVDFSEIELNSHAGEKIEQKEDELRRFLMSLDFEVVKDIQTIMYLGRDREYDRQQSFQERFLSARQDAEKGGWEGKDVEVTMIVDKSGLLSEYLHTGMEILGF